MSFVHDPDFTSWGPFIQHDTFLTQPVSRTDVIIAGVTFGIICVFACSAAYVGVVQTRKSQQPWKSAYLWMIWLEWAACIVIGVEAILYLLKVIRPSFYFFMSLLLVWVVQTQLLLQIIVIRIRIIIHDRKRGKQLMIWTAITMSIINISVFCIWIPARLQISERWMRINDVWDRVEKVFYLIIDVYLNVYFIRTVKANLVRNGLQKYERLVRFNQTMICVSLLMDLVIVGAMSIPNGSVYLIFHPLAYLVKLNIEMSMARLIKKIALGSNTSNQAAYFPSITLNSDAKNDGSKNGIIREWAVTQRSSMRSFFVGGRPSSTAAGGVITKTKEFTVRSTPKEEWELQPPKQFVHIRANEVEPKSDAKLANHVTGVTEKRASIYTSDEESLITCQPVVVRARRSEDSSGSHSMASTRT